MKARITASREHGLCLLALLFFAVLSSHAGAAEPMRLEFAGQRPAGAKVYSSDAGTPWGTLRVIDGGTVTLQLESGRHYEVRAGGWRWSQVQEVPANVDAVQVTPHVDGGEVTLDIMVYQQEEDRRHSYSTTTRGSLGEWLQVLGPVAKPGVKVFGAGAGNRQGRELYIRASVVEG
jgi:hypothetical protein